MAALVLKDCTIWANQYDLTSDTNEVAVAMSADNHDSTTFGSGGWHENLTGLKSTQVDIKSFLNTATDRSESVLNALNGVAGTIVTVTPTGLTGERAYFGKGLETDLTEGLKVGEIAAISGQFNSCNSEGFLQGTILVPKTTAGATATGTAYQVGAVSSTQYVRAALHVFAGSGTLPTLDVKIQSDTVGFPSATDRITFTQATGATTEYKSLAGAITDDYWRVVYTVAGTGPSFTFAVVLAIA